MSPATVEIHLTSKWIRCKDELFKCSKCTKEHFGNAYRLVVISHGFHRSNTTVPNLIICTKCYKYINDNFQ